MQKNITTVVFVAFAGGMIGRALRYLINVVIARGLGAEALGTFAFGMVVLKLLAVFSRLGFDNAALKYVPRYRDEGSDSYILGLTIVGLGFPMATGIVLGVGVTVGEPLLSPFFNQRLLETLPLFAIGIPLLSTMFVGMAITRGYDESKYAVYTRDIGQSLTAIVLVAAGAFILNDFAATVLGYVVSMGVGVALVAWFLRRQEALRFDRRPEFEIREWFTFSVPMLAIAVTQFLTNWTDILMLGAFVSAEEIGWYQAAYQTTLLLLVVLQSANSIFPSIASRLYDRGERERLESTYIGMTKWIVYLTALGGVFLILYRSEVLRLFGETAPEAETALVVLAVGQFTVAGVGATGYLLSMSGYERVESVNTFAVVLLNIALNYVLIQQYGIVGAGAATAISLGLLNLVRLAEVRWFLGLQPYHRTYWRGGIATAIGVGILLLGRYLPLFPLAKAFVAGLLGLGGFLGSMYLLGIDEYDRLLIESLE
jgi:O-antigen/teichoic acid export membrane protein